MRKNEFMIIPSNGGNNLLLLNISLVKEYEESIVNLAIDRQIPVKTSELEYKQVLPSVMKSYRWKENPIQNSLRVEDYYDFPDKNLEEVTAIRDKFFNKETFCKEFSQRKFVNLLKRSIGDLGFSINTLEFCKNQGWEIVGDIVEDKEAYKILTECPNISIKDEVERNFLGNFISIDIKL
jgi:hypothetical protein